MCGKNIHISKVKVKLKYIPSYPVVVISTTAYVASSGLTELSATGTRKCKKQMVERSIVLYQEKQSIIGGIQNVPVHCI